MTRRGRLLLRRIRRLLALSSAERRLLVRGFVKLWAVDLGLRAWGFRRFIERAQRAAVSAGRPIGAEDLRRAREYARCLEVASRHHPVRARCLHQSLALHRWLLEDGLPSGLRIGVRKESGELNAHAWVELGGNVVGDQPAVVAAFTPIASVDNDEQPVWAYTNNSPARQAVRTSAGAIEWR